MLESTRHLLITIDVLVVSRMILSSVSIDRKERRKEREEEKFVRDRLPSIINRDNIVR